MNEDQYRNFSMYYTSPLRLCITPRRRRVDRLVYVYNTCILANTIRFTSADTETIAQKMRNQPGLICLWAKTAAHDGLISRVSTILNHSNTGFASSNISNFTSFLVSEAHFAKFKLLTVNVRDPN